MERGPLSRVCESFILAGIITGLTGFRYRPDSNELAQYLRDAEYLSNLGYSIPFLIYYANMMHRLANEKMKGDVSNVRAYLRGNSSLIQERQEFETCEAQFGLSLARWYAMPISWLKYYILNHGNIRINERLAVQFTDMFQPLGLKEKEAQEAGHILLLEVINDVFRPPVS